MTSKNVADTPTGTRPQFDVEDFFTYFNRICKKKFMKKNSPLFLSITEIRSFVAIFMDWTAGKSGNERQLECVVKVSETWKIKFDVLKLKTVV